jgi:predicted Zn-dependent protease
VRFNHGRIRQAGTVAREGAELRLASGGRSVGLTLTLGGGAEDGARLDEAAAALRVAIADAPPDPWSIHDTEPAQSHRIEPARSPSPDELADTVRDALDGEDLVGFHMGGPMAAGLASSLGHRHYHEGGGSAFEFSIYAPSAGRPELRDKAVKSSIAQRDWDGAAMTAAIRAAAVQVPLLMRPMRRLDPGRHRAWLAPRAMAELLQMLNWGGVSARAHLTGQSPLDRLRRGEVRLDARVSIAEDLAAAGVPRFQSQGFVRPARVPLVEQGAFADWLASPRSAREFGIASNAAGGDESAEALHLQPGTLPEADAWAALGTGLAISNLWYLNFSDRQSCRVTGMTRFATLWIEDGQPVAPVEVMRFDDALFELLGPRLVALGDRAHWLPDSSSYDWRAFGGIATPGALFDGLQLTL